MLQEAITDNVRLVYYVEGNVIWLLTVGKHKEVYVEFVKRLHSLHLKLKERT